MRAKVASLTAQLTEEHKMGSIGRLLAGIVHEINSPIGAILSNNQVIIRSLELVGKAMTGGDAAALEKAGSASLRLANRWWPSTKLPASGFPRWFAA